MLAKTLSDKVARAAAILLLPAWGGVIGGELSKSGAGIHLWDKALHFSAYFILAGLAGAALYDRRKLQLSTFAGLIAMGGILEIVQGLIGRDCDIRDEYANALGVLAGAVIAWVVMATLVRLNRSD